MADKLTQFYNNSAITFSELRSGLNLVVTSLTEQAVVKDLYIDNTPPCRLLINDLTIDTSMSSGKYSGTEIIGLNSVMKLLPVVTTVDAPPNLFSVLTGATTGTKYILQPYNLLTNDSITLSAIASITYTTGFPTTCKFIFKDKLGHLWGHDGSSAVIYRRASETGAVTSYQANSTNQVVTFVAYDGDDYIYTTSSVNASIGRISVTAPANATGIANTVSGADSPAMYGGLAAVPGGWVLTRATYTSLVYLQNVTTGAYYIFSNIDVSNAGSCNVSIIKNAAGEYVVFIYRHDNGNIVIKNLGKNLLPSGSTSISSYDSAVSFSGSGALYDDNTVSRWKKYLNTPYLYIGSGSGNKVFIYNGITGRFTESTSFLGFQHGLYLDRSDTDYNTYFPSMSCRVTGIRSTD